MGSGGLALASGISQGFAQGQKDKVKNDYQKALIEMSKLQTKQLEQEINLKNQTAEYVKLHPEFGPVLMGLEKPRDPMERAIMQELFGGSGKQDVVAPIKPQQQSMNLAPGMSELMPTIGEVAETNNLPPTLLANLINTESGGRNVQNAQGKPYWGPGQVGIEAARDVWGPEAKHPSQMTPQENVATAGAYLRQLLDKNNQDMNKALTQYGGFVTQNPSEYIGKITGQQSLPDTAAQMQVQQGLKIDKNKFLQGYLNKKYGYPEDEVHWLKGIAGPKGPISVGVDKRTGKPLPGLVMDESVKPEALDIQMPGGLPGKGFFPPFGGQQVGTTIPQPFKIEGVEQQLPGGATFRTPTNPYTGQPMAPTQSGGTPEGLQVKPAGATTVTEAGRLNMMANAHNVLNDLEGMVFNKDGTLNNANLFGKAMPFGGQGTEPRIINSAGNIITSAILRTETGAQSREEEVRSTVERYIPSVFDTRTSAKWKMEQLRNYVEGFFKFRDPSGEIIGFKDIELKTKADKKMINTAEDFLKKKGIKQ